MSCPQCRPKAHALPWARAMLGGEPRRERPVAAPGAAVPVHQPHRRLPAPPEQSPLTFLRGGTATARPEQRQHRPEQRHGRRHHGDRLPAGPAVRELARSGSDARGTERGPRGCRSCATHQTRPRERAEETGGDGSSSSSSSSRAAPAPARGGRAPGPGRDRGQESGETPRSSGVWSRLCPRGTAALGHRAGDVHRDRQALSKRWCRRRGVTLWPDSATGGCSWLTLMGYLCIKSKQKWIMMLCTARETGSLIKYLLHTFLPPVTFYISLVNTKSAVFCF